MSAVNDAEIMIQLAQEEGDESIIEEVDRDLTIAEKEIEEIKRFTFTQKGSVIFITKAQRNFILGPFYFLLL